MIYCSNQLNATQTLTRKIESDPTFAHLISVCVRLRGPHRTCCAELWHCCAWSRRGGGGAPRRQTYCENPEFRQLNGINLASFLLEPMQRITRSAMPRTLTDPTPAPRNPCASALTLACCVGWVCCEEGVCVCVHVHTRYPILIRAILHRTDSSNPDHPDLMTALDTAERWATKINEAVRKQEDSQQLQALQRCAQSDTDGC